MSDNWYQVVSRPGVQIGRSNPDTDPSGYQLLPMLKLAEQCYHQPGPSAKVPANAPASNMGDTDGAPLRPADGADRLPGYLPLRCAPASPQVRGAAGPDQPQRPEQGQHPDAGPACVQALLGPEGQKVLKDNGFQALQPTIVAV
jgi:molybdate/tungstate transport system substrate-binding protein